MSRRTLVVFAVVAGFVAGIVPAGVAVYLAWDDAVSQQQTYLRILAVTTVKRWERLYESSTTLLAELANDPAPHCSDAHIARLREAMRNVGYVREIGVFAEGRVSCLSATVGGCRDPAGYGIARSGDRTADHVDLPRSHPGGGPE
jgi:sensor c-di-GMP phosphodiesterase-like protein